MRKSVLTIAGADPSGGAGIQRDLETFQDFGINGLSVITALTAQNKSKVKAVLHVPAVFVIKQINAVIEENKIDAVKLGMLARTETVLAIASLLRRIRFKNLIIDPVMVSSSGYPLLEKRAIKYLRDYLIPLAHIVTPNLYEAAVLANIKSVSNIEEMKLSAIIIKKLGPEFVLIKGGHLKEAAGKGQGARGKKAVDILYDGKEFTTFSALRINKDIHGTGCIFSSAIAAGMANGLNVYNAVKKAKVYTTKVINRE